MVDLRNLGDRRGKLAAGLRRNVANIRLFAFKQTLSAMVDPKPEYLGSLISINCELAAGLLGRA